MESQNNKQIIQDQEISEMDSIFEKISNKYKNKKDEYLLKKVLDEKKASYIGREKTSEEIEKGAFLSFDYPHCYLEKDNKTIFIKFLVKARFLDSENNKRFSFWVCSFDYLKEKLQSMGYKRAKIGKDKLFVEDEEKKVKGSRSSSGESLENSNEIDIKLKKEVNVYQNIFSLENIFDKSQEIFNPAISFKNIEDYEKDIEIPETKNKDKLKFNKNYITDLTEIIMDKKNGLYCYFYNKKSGLTLSLIQLLEKNRKLIKTRYFYFNSEYINKYKKKYFYFRIAKMFQKDEKELFLELLKPEEGESIKYNSSYISKILNKILKQLKGVHIIFDNIQDINIFNKVMKVLTKMNKIKEYIEITEKDKDKGTDEKAKYIETKKIRFLNNYTVSLFLPINDSNLEIIDSSIIYQSNISSLFPSDNACTQELTPTEYINSLVQDNYDSKEYKQNIKEKISKFIDNNNKIEYLIFLIEILHLKQLLKNKNLLYYNNNIYLMKFLPYIYVSLKIENNSISVDKIKFRTNFIEEIIYDQINFLLSKNIITDDVFKFIRTKSTEGIYIEKEIIYYLITKIINFEKAKIEKIYCFDSNVDEKIITYIKNKKNIIFIQKSESAPLYDFGVIIYINGKPIFKGYQIGINKPLSSLLQLYIEKVKIDSLYFISKINKLLDEKITEFSFGIITTKYAYDSQTKNNIIKNDNNNNFNHELEIDNYDDRNNDKKEEEKDNEYKNYNTMKKFCNDNKYEFLIFDPINNSFFINKNENLENIVFHDYYDKNLMNNVTNYICRNEDNYNLTKLPIYPNEITKTDREYISNSINTIAKDKQLNLVGKFEKDENINIDFDLINDNYLIYSNFKEKKIIYFKKKIFCDDSKDSDITYSIIFYIFDTSLNKAKKGRKKKDMNLNNNIILISEKDADNENNKEEKNLLRKKRKEDDEENNDDEQDNNNNKRRKNN